MSHCIECGTKLKPDDQFCPECGVEAVKKEPEPESKDSSGGSWLRVVMLVLVVMMLISSLVFFGAIFSFSSGNFKMPAKDQRVEENRCEFNAEFTCLHSTIHQNVVVLSLKNDGSNPILIEHINVLECGGTDFNIELAGGEKQNFLVKCTPGSLGQYVEQRASVLYTGSNGYPIRGDGLITGIVQMKLQAAE